MECVAYIRVSTERQAEEGYGLESQKRDIDEYCRKHQLIIKEYYVDAGLSGMEMSKRVELQRLISDMAKIDVIVVYKLDRLARDTVDALYMIGKIFTPKGICVESVHDFARYETPQDKFQTQVMAVFIVVSLADRSRKPAHTDAVAAHNGVMQLALSVGILHTHGLGILGAELEYISDLDTS